MLSVVEDLGIYKRAAINQQKAVSTEDFLHCFQERV